MTKRLDPEIKVLRAINRGLRATDVLDLNARRRVLAWTSDKAYAEMRKPPPPNPEAGPGSEEGAR